MQDSFFISAADEPHRTRSREIIAKHPEVGKLIGRNPATFILLVLIVSGQVAMSFWMGSLGIASWGYAILAAFAIGAFANHCLYVIIHEATHNLIFKKRVLNKICGVVADIPNVLPGALAFRNYHIKHHAYMGDHDFDADLPNIWEAKVVQTAWWRKALWLLVFPIMQVSRSFSTYKVNTYEKWFYINAIVLIITDILIVQFFGWNGLIYLLASMFFGLGLHPLGARWIQEHYTLSPDQETYSYYGPLNIVALNVGYHNEHHDFPAIPWNRLPKLREIAPEYYNTLIYHTSWTKLLLSFIFNKEYSLFSRIIRSEKVKKGERKVDPALAVNEVAIVNG